MLNLILLIGDFIGSLGEKPEELLKTDIPGPVDTWLFIVEAIILLLGVIFDIFFNFSCLGYKSDLFTLSLLICEGELSLEAST